MSTAGSWRDRLPRGIAVGVIAILAVAVLPPEAGTAQTTIEVRTCKKLDVELHDPDQASVWTKQSQINPPALATESVLPIAADPTALAREDVRLAFSVIRIEGGKPVSERLGEWTLRVRRDRGAPITLKFTLQQPPG